MSETTPAINGEKSDRPKVSLWELAKTFNDISLMSFGGGLSAWSRRIIVEVKGWMDDEEFLSALTLCRVMPGANQVNLAVYVGTRFRGVAGAIATVFGLCLIPVLIALGLAVAYFHYHQVPDVEKILKGMAAAAVGLTLSMGLKTGAKFLKEPVALIFGVLAFLGAGLMKMPLLLVIGVLGPIAVWWGYRKYIETHKKT
ncbi:MAG: chromate transporter [Chthoniobacterales bacterium]